MATHSYELYDTTVSQENESFNSFDFNHSRELSNPLELYNMELNKKYLNQIESVNYENPFFFKEEEFNTTSRVVLNKPKAPKQALLTTLFLLCGIMASLYIYKMIQNKKPISTRIKKIDKGTWKELELINQELFDWYIEYNNIYPTFTLDDFLSYLDSENSTSLDNIRRLLKKSEGEMNIEEASTLLEFKDTVYSDIVIPHMTRVNWALYGECFRALRKLIYIDMQYNGAIYSKIQGMDILNSFGKSPFRINHMYGRDYNYINKKELKEKMDKLIDIFDRAGKLLTKPYDTFIQYADMATMNEVSKIQDRMDSIKL